MNSGDPDRTQEIFAEAIQVSPNRRAAFLDQACAGKPDQRSSVEGLLRALDDAGRDGFLTSPTSAESAGGTLTPPWPDPSGTIGPYRLLERLGEGGFGEVWTAEQTKPMRRTVALKILKPGMDSKEVLARFEIERQALALMDHPNVARVYDAGTTDQGRPYFVMEHAAGLPLTDYCDAGRLRVRQRLELFVRVCEAVQHAHTKGIIHRDLKPSNILITLADGKPAPKVIDFGIAKATAAPLTDRTLYTNIGRVMGTPEYMSPEQAGTSGLDVDTRSDVYSLGVILYQLLTGTLPFEPHALRKVDHSSLVKIIREMEPPTPSGRLSTLGAEPVNRHNGNTPQEIAARRDTEFAALRRQVKGELDWIVMKCLEKERTRRYETANGLASDVQHFLSGEPVVAAPPSRLYRFRKFVRRNRATVTAAVVVAFSLLAGMAGTTFGLLRAEQRRVDAEAAQGRERQQRELAEKREKETQQVSDFLAAMWRHINRGTMGRRRIKERLREQVRAELEWQLVGEFPDRRKRTPEEVKAELAAFDQHAKAALAVDVARRVMLARAAQIMEEEFAHQPLVRARLHDAIGRAYRDLKVDDAAEPHLRAALKLRRAHYGPQTAHADVVKSLLEFAQLKDDKGRYSEAELLYRDVLDMSRELGHRGNEAKTLERLGAAVMFQRRFPEADLLLSEALRLRGELHGEDHELFYNCLKTFAVLRGKQGLHAEAETINRRVLEWRRKHYGPQHSKVAHVLFNLAYEVGAQGRDRAAKAETLFRDSLAIYSALHGDEHRLVAKTWFHIGMQLVRQGRREEGKDCYQTALDQQRRLLGDEHREVRQTLKQLALLHWREGDHDKAVALLREDLVIAGRLYPKGHPEAYRRFGAMAELAGVLCGQAKVLLPTDRERALALFQEAEPMIIDLAGMKEDPRSGLPNRRQRLEWTATVFEYFHKAAPDRGWSEQAAKWQAELEKLRAP